MKLFKMEKSKANICPNCGNEIGSNHAIEICPSCNYKVFLSTLVCADNNDKELEISAEDYENCNGALIFIDADTYSETFFYSK